jgi:hypothetical protein
MEYPAPATVLPLNRLIFNSSMRQGQVFSFLGQFGGLVPHDPKCKFLNTNAAALATFKLYTNRLRASGTWVVAMIIVFFQTG